MRFELATLGVFFTNLFTIQYPLSTASLSATHARADWLLD